MSFVGNQVVNMMIAKIKQNNPNISPYIEKIQNGENANEVLKSAIQNGAITRQQFNNAKPLLIKYGKQMGINVSQQDIQSLESTFNSTPKTNGFRF